MYTSARNISVKKPISLLALLLPGLLWGCLGGGSSGSSASGTPTQASSVQTLQTNDGTDLPGTPKGSCGPGSRPELGLQGRVSQEDHDSGRAAAGFTCNTELVSSFVIPNTIGTVGGFKVERYTDKNGRDCAYYDSTLLFPTNILDMELGVNVFDMSDPTKPVRTARLVTPAMLSPHESLVLSQEGGVLAQVRELLARLLHQLQPWAPWKNA